MGVAALDQESQRMKQIGYLIAEERHILNQWAPSFIQGLAECKNIMCRQVLVQQWLGQAIVSNTSLQEVWDEVSVWIAGWEASVPINVWIRDGTDGFS